MIEIGKTYRLKKIKGLNTNSEEEYKILAIYPSENKELGDIAVYDNHGQRYVAPVNAFIDPEDPEEYSPWEITKIESVYEKELMEECGGCAAAASCSGGMGSLGTAPTPALVSSFANGGPTRVNGVPVAGKSTKKKKKKKHENIDIIWNIEEDFHEAYERITNLLAKQLDRMNFEFANTEEIIYKKEGKYKYLLKFDNENGFLKFNISQDGNIIWEKEWELEEKEDVTPIFQEIEDVYNQYGI